MTMPIIRSIYDNAHSARLASRKGELTTSTSGVAPGYQQGNLVILPKKDAEDFLRFCVLNPKPAPILDVSEPGDVSLARLGSEIDIRFDVPKYRIFRDGIHAETVSDLSSVWRADLVTFVLGCSFSFEDALVKANIPVRHMDNGKNVPMYVTDVETVSAGCFGGPMVVSMRPFAPKSAIQAMILSAQMPEAHGAPIHFGDPSIIGIKDIMKPDFGDAPDILLGEVPVFWACGVTPQTAILRARPSLAITHEPGHMLVTDLRSDGGRTF
ncbi:putative hydro-lyase [Ochrobactrum quorumnocens]|nr:putative hydro-lyase [[Ochrobactrum] quorumnocens]